MSMTCQTCEPDSCCVCDLYENDEAVTIDGISQHGSALAVKQTHDVGDMTADFIIVSRQNNEPNLNGNLVQLGKSKFGEGIDLAYHEIARPVLLEHGFDVPFPIGVSEDIRGRYSVKRQGKNMLGTVRFSQVLPEAEMVFAMIDEGTLRMASVSYRIMKAMVLKQKAHGTLPAGVEDWSHHGRGRGHDFVETLLLEWSIVHSGADRGSIRQGLDRGRFGTARIPASLTPFLTKYAEDRQSQGIGFTAPTEVILAQNKLAINVSLPDELCESPAFMASMQTETERLLKQHLGQMDRESSGDSPKEVDTNAASQSDHRELREIDTHQIGRTLADAVLKDGEDEFSVIGNEIAKSL